MSTEAPLRLYISPLTRPYTIPYRRAQTFDDFRTTANRILVSCIETGELQAGCSESVPQPNHWNVVDETGAIVSSVLWQDLVVPGGTYCLLPRQEIAAVSSPMRTSESHSSATESAATTRSRSATAISSASISPVSSSSGSVSSAASGNEIRNVSYRDALSTSVIGTGRPTSGSSYSFFGGDDESGVRLGSESPSSSCSRPIEKRDDNHTHTPQNTHVMRSARSFITGGSPWSAVVASGLSPQQSNHQTQQHNLNAHPVTANNNSNNNTNNNPGSTAVSDWTLVQARKPVAQPTIKPLVQIKVWKNETVPSSARSYTVPPTISVGAFIERIGGREGCRVQEMKRVREGFLPGLTYMWGTQKSIEDVGWADRKRGTVGVYLHMPPRFD
ncbi:unnamed protein product [Tuber melanosporum]|uniref:(Perigord truffle) hypothetical protein n=1 Tax=Tuber melanosporum (strain Mel28) TaxID=656061 RepID=D5GG96_TUBMM|nr:uncharacterized protein GSTUM_00007280001 [Tuber melanosporum]CAZ83539.1 unnamed protein product [Tuber melanosporum]